MTTDEVTSFGSEGIDETVDKTTTSFTDYATELARAGTPVKVLMTLMRHQSLQTTMKYYAKVEGQDIARVRDHLNQRALG